MLPQKLPGAAGEFQQTLVRAHPGGFPTSNEGGMEADGHGRIPIETALVAELIVGGTGSTEDFHAR
jgi:hypothetical protein